MQLTRDEILIVAPPTIFAGMKLLPLHYPLLGAYRRTLISFWMTQRKDVSKSQTFAGCRASNGPIAQSIPLSLDTAYLAAVNIGYSQSLTHCYYFSTNESSLKALSLCTTAPTKFVLIRFARSPDSAKRREIACVHGSRGPLPTCLNSILR